MELIVIFTTAHILYLLYRCWRELGVVKKDETVLKDIY